MLKKLKRIIIITLIVSLLCCSNSFLAYAYNSYITECESKISTKLSTAMYNSSHDDIHTVQILFNSSEIENVSEVFFSSNIHKLYNNNDIQELRKFRQDLNKTIKNKCIEINSLNSYLTKNVNIKYVSDTAPYVIAEVNNSDINYLMKQQNVSNIDISEHNYEPCSLDTTANTIRARTIQNNGLYGYTGYGINIGMIESRGYPDTNVESLKNCNITKYTNSPTTSHATEVAEILVGKGSTQVGRGIAPDANLFCGATITTDLENILNWFVDECYIDVVNLSMGTSQYELNEYSILSSILDYYSTVYRITVVCAAGNEGINGVNSLAMSYNAITVGNLYTNSSNTANDDFLNYGSSYYNCLLPQNLPSKPDLVAPGSPVSLEYGPVTGTSYAAPHVTGAIALCGEQDMLLLVCPSAIKALLAAGVYQNSFCFVPNERILTTNSNEIPLSYIQYGAGLINCIRNSTIINNQNYDFSTLYANSTYIDFNITCNANQNIRVALAYEKNVNTVSIGDALFYDSSSLIDNLNLMIYDANMNLVGSSETTYNNLEIVDFIPSTSGNYTIRIIRGISQLNSDVRFGIAWIQS